MSLSPSLKRTFIVLTFALLLADPLASQTADKPPTSNNATASDAFELTAERLYSPWEGELNNAGWLYRAGDDTGWATVDYDDRAWEKIRSTQLNTMQLPRDGWSGVAWFRLHIAVDERIALEPVALRLRHWGASEIYLDGKLLKRFGRVSTNDRTDVGSSGEVEENPRGLPVPLTFETGGEHVIAVRYSFNASKDMSKGKGAWLARARFRPGFSFYIQTANGAISDAVGDIRNTGTYKLYLGILYAFALLHFLLFVFYRRERTNLFYSLFAFCLGSASLLSNIVNGGGETAVASAVMFILFVGGYSAAFLALQAFLYEAFMAGRFSKFFHLTIFIFIGLLIFLIIFVRDRMTLYATCVFFAISLADSLRLVVTTVWRRRDGAWIIATGVLVFAVGILMLVSREFQYFQDSEWYAGVSDIASILGVPVAVSVYLARNFARTNRDLTAQLAQVKEYSEREVEHERNAARLLIVEAENERRAKELEEARQLQLSMLPKKLPQFPNLEIAAYMKPATEVGGDYYDFHVSDDGTLTVAVGDATGHGLKAGTVVTATKSLFNNLAHEPDIENIFKQSSAALKAMNLRGMFMAMAMLKIKDERLVLSIAGMPSALVYHDATGDVEEISIRAMPLGSLANLNYQQQEVQLAGGDCVVLMSDGFPEMFNEQNEMLGYAQAKRTLEKTAGASPQQIIDRFVEVGERWANGRPPDDDVTFVVLKVIN